MSRKTAVLAGCANCGLVWKESELREIKDIFQRCEPGGEFPAGECPRCGALCYIRQKKSAPVTYAETAWTAEDVSTMRPKWSKRRCTAELAKIENHLRDNLIAAGWGIMADLLPVR